MTTPVSPKITEEDVRTALDLQNPIEFTLNVGDYVWVPDGMAQGPSTVRFRLVEGDKITYEMLP